MGLEQWEGRCYWHLVGRGPGCCKHSVVHMTAPHSKKIIPPQILIVADIEKSQLEILGGNGNQIGRGVRNKKNH